MRLVDFIERNLEDILVDWESFARSLAGASSMDKLVLRDHAKQILEAVCRDLEHAQTRVQEIQKSKGLALPLDARETAAQTHAVLRARAGFNINQMASEYRALRASVIRIWIDACAPDHPDLQELVRFNEAIDQAVCESIGHFNSEIERSRNLLLGILGHDMRTPLSAIQMTAHYLKGLNNGAEVSVAAERLIRSGARIKALLDDLTVFNHARLGSGIPIARAEIDLAEVFDEQVQLLRAAYPERTITLKHHGNLVGNWDPNRLHQILGNLVVNALRHGDSTGSVRILLVGGDNEVVFTVANDGARISPTVLNSLFAPLVQGSSPAQHEGSLGLGLFICREICIAHGGQISAQSSATETIFTVRLPRDGSMRVALAG